VADDLGPLDAELAHQQAAVAGMSGHRDRSLQAAAASEPGPVVGKQPVAAGENWLVQQRPGPHGARPPVDEHDWFPRAAQLILQSEPVPGDPVHVSYPRPKT
jgi:hypothetical protein